MKVNTQRELPLVSVLMSCYNAEEFIDEAINSLISQTYKHLEFIFINDGSTDKTLEKLNSFEDQRINIISHENKGIVASLNIGLKHCKGAYIARMDADDISSQDRIEKLVLFLEQHPEVLACGGAIEEFNEKGTIKVTKKPLCHDDLLFYSLHRAPISNPSSMIRNIVFKEKGLSYDPIYKYGQDVKLWFEIAKIGKLANIEDILLRYRKSLTQVTTKHRNEQKKLAKSVRQDTYLFIQENWTRLQPISNNNQYYFYKYMVKSDLSLSRFQKLTKLVKSSMALRYKLALSFFAIFK